MKKISAVVLPFLLISPFSPHAADHGFGVVDETEFRRLHALVKPQDAENAWLQIPWETDLWAARTRAAAEAKPIFLWEMDGHPLGCV